MRFFRSRRPTPRFAVGDRVGKSKGYRFPGFVVSVFRTRAGELRYVVEADHPYFAGMLHIFNGEQLETWDKIAP